ncbi:hypothetical protein ACI0FR_02379 [Paenochrobactrum sp. BZR 201-1]
MDTGHKKNYIREHQKIRTTGGAPLRMASFALAACLITTPVLAEQNLKPLINSGEKLLEFDWPALQIGTGEYEEGPTGVTVFKFGKKSLGAVDVRGGAPGTVNTDYLRLGYEKPELDAVVFSGGSWYGLESTTAVATGLKDDNIRNGYWDNLALTVGAIIYDFGDRRLNEVYPDKKLAQAALRAVRPGVFPLGSQGAGRFARSGGFFGCGSYSGQGGAFRQIGDIKIAAFTVVNAGGVITDRDGSIVTCFKDSTWPESTKTADLFAGVPHSRKLGWDGVPQGADNKNTTISLVVTNQKMTYAELQRLAVQVHTSMGRGLQPFATVNDGDVLYAVSTGEVGDDVKAGGMSASDLGAGISTGDLGAIASEVMWDAILASVPEQPKKLIPAEDLKLSEDNLAKMTGKYVFSPFVTVEITHKDGQLYAQAVGDRPAFAIGKEKPVKLSAVSENLFTVADRYPLALQFDEASGLTINPGHWEQKSIKSSK